jgi:hypothetical protein
VKAQRNRDTPVANKVTNCFGFACTVFKYVSLNLVVQFIEKQRGCGVLIFLAWGINELRRADSLGDL